LHIGTEDSAELTFKTLCGHGITPQGPEIERKEAMDISGASRKDILRLPIFAGIKIWFRSVGVGKY
jgi:hypothetical protein